MKLRTDHKTSAYDVMEWLQENEAQLGITVKIVEGDHPECLDLIVEGTGVVGPNANLHANTGPER